MSSSAAAKTPPEARVPATEADLLALEAEDDRSFELIDGELIEKQAGFRHGHAQVGVSGLLRPAWRRGGGDGEPPGAWWILTEQLVRLSRDQRLLKPDLSGWRRARFPTPPPEDDDGIIEERPDWVCEIISPRKAAQDRVRKKRIYHQHQISHYWIIDPREKSLFVFRWTDAGYVEVLAAEQGDVVRAEPFAELELVLADLFVDAEES